MTWSNPAAWLGVAFVALPIVVHLLGRTPARVLRFPTLRFLGASRVLPRRRTRIHDPLLLAVRIAVIVLAAAALARPRFGQPGASVAGSTAGRLARAIIVDTSASMRRVEDGQAARPGTDVAAERADSLARGATVATPLMTADLPTALPGAAEWLAQQPMRGEIVIVSDFAGAALDSLDVARVPAAIAVRLSRVAMHDSGDPRTADVTSDALRLLADPRDSVRLRATRVAAATLVHSAPADSARRVAIVFPSFADRATLRRDASTHFDPWMVDVVMRLRRDPLLAQAAFGALANTTWPTALAAAFDSVRHVVVDAARARIDGHDVLVLFSAASAGSLTAAALVAATERATSTAAPPWEADGQFVSDRRLRTWERDGSVHAAPSSRSSGATERNAPLTRWLWGAVIALLAVESRLRRTRTQAEPTLASHDRAA